jgi:poly-gamma-glutamate capsule biosynthesis protein CapA/YwtB (metallophosphatase superfamily)
MNPRRILDQQQPPDRRRRGRRAAVTIGVVVVGALSVALASAGAGRSTMPASPIAATPPTAALATAVPPTSGQSPSGVEMPTPSPVPPVAATPIVPVADFRSTADSIGPAEIAALLSGKSPRWKAIELVATEADAILAALGTSRGTAGAFLVEAPDAVTLMGDLAAHRQRLGFLRADEVGPGVRALGWGGVSLFGIRRLTSLADWKLTAVLPALQSGGGAQPAAPYDPATTWTMFVAGDLGFDRTVSLVVKGLKKGVDYPYDGGTAKITGTTCCSPFGWTVPTIVSTGNRGAMRDLISSADLALANMEEPTPDRWVYHPHGTVFTGDPALLAGVARAGFDVVSCATTHIGDGGKAGILQTVANLAKVGIRAFGCGRNLAAARAPAVFEIGGTKVAILGYDSISARYYGATATTIGSAPLTAASVKADVAAARAAGAQVVIVYPHWGTEYQFGPNAFQKQMGHLMIDAGADIVIGNHGHWVQSVEVYKGKPIWYALGNFTFDQSWSEPTLEGVSLELTFRGGTLAQARMNPHVLVLAVQPNLLDPATDGQRVLAPVFKASGALLPW